jgi:AcrR family transcriptional regulator
MAARIVDRVEKSRLILQAAARVFAQRGFQAATIDEISERAGIGKGTVYEYFPSKQDLFYAVFTDYIAGFEIAAREQARQAAGSAARIREVIGTVLAMTAASREWFPLTFEFWSASAAPRHRRRIATMFRRMYGRFRKMLADLIRQGQRAGEFDPHADARHVASVLVGALDGLFLQSWFDPKLDPVAAGNSFLEVLLRGLAPGARPRRKQRGDK